jgi:hypothetical protein
MIVVDRPSMDISHKYFSEWFDGDKPTSPNGLPYLFLPLHKKTYKDEERRQIVLDNEHHAGNSSVVALRGVQDLDKVLTLVNGVNITIRKLLLSVPAQGTTSGILFDQIERQSNSSWLLCCFPSMDAAKVTIRLSSLEDSLKKYVRDTNHQELFDEDGALQFCGQVAPVPKGKQLPRIEVPAHVQDYASRSLRKLYTPTAKHQAIAVEEDSLPEVIPVVTPRARSNIATDNLGSEFALPKPQPPTAIEATISNLQEASRTYGNTLETLEKCCFQLAATTEKLSLEVRTLNADFNQRFYDIHTTLDKLTNSPSWQTSNFHKDHHWTTRDFYV